MRTRTMAMATRSSTKPLAVPTATALKLTLHGRTDPVALTNSLADLVKVQQKTNKIVQELHINIDVSFNVGRLTTRNGKKLMQAFGKLPSLKTVVVRGRFRAPFPVSALTALFAAAHEPAFVRFCLFQMILVGPQDEFDKFALALGRHQKLQVFDIDMTHFFQQIGPANFPVTIPAKANLDPLITALLRIPTLKVLLLGGCDVSSLEGSITTGVMEELFHSKTIERLSLVNFSFSLPQVMKITSALENNNRLRHLCISCASMGTNSKNDTSSTSCVTSQQSREGGKALAHMLRMNKTLQKLILYIADLDKNEELNMEIFQGVSSSETLKGIYLGSLEDISPRSKQALIEMLQTNYVLEEFGFVCANQQVTSGLYPYSYDIIKEMTLYLRLNKAGRRKLLQNDNASRKQWVDALIDVKNDLGCIYYLLSRNPTALLEPALHSKEGQRATTKSLKRPNITALANDFDEPIRKRKRLYRASKYTRVSYR